MGISYEMSGAMFDVGADLVPSSNKPLPKPMFTKFCDAIRQ